MKNNATTPLRQRTSVFVFLTLLGCLLLPTVFRSDAATITAKSKQTFFRVYYGSNPVTSSSTGLSYTIYISYNATTQTVLIDGIDDANGNPVSITSSSITVNSWNVPNLIVSFSASFTYSGGSDSVSDNSKSFSMS